MKKKLAKQMLSAALAASMVAGSAVTTSAAGTDAKASDFMAEMTEKYASENLATSERPQARWWLCGGYHTRETLENEIQELFNQGYGGIELLDYEGGSVIDVDRYGWGTEEWYEDCLTIVKKCAELGMSVSFAAGPQWQPDFPYYEEDPDYSEPLGTYETDPNSDVYNQGLVTGSAVYVTDGNTVQVNISSYTYEPSFATEEATSSEEADADGWYSAKYTGYGTTLFRYANTISAPVEEDSPVLQPFGTNVDKSDYTVDADNFQNMMIVKVDEVGSKTYKASDVLNINVEDYISTNSQGETIFTYTPEDNGIYMLVPMWRVGTGYGTNAETSSMGTYYFVNQYSEEAADALYAFWKKYMLTDEMQEQIDIIVAKGGSVDWFMDSMEVSGLNSNGVDWWAYNFDEKFQEYEGYDLYPYMANYVTTTAGQTSGGFGGPGGPGGGTVTKNRDYDFTILDDNGDKVDMEEFITDYDYMLTETFNDFMEEMCKDFGQSNMGIRAQVYGANINVISYGVQAVTVPETETLHFGESPSSYKLEAGAVHLTGKDEFSSESGALAGSYIYTAQDYMKCMYQQAIAGVNRIVWHGFSAVAGPDAATRWPGFESSMGFTQSERWANRSPLMVLDTDYQGHLTRLQTVLKQGTDLADVAVICEGATASRKTFLSDPTALLSAGYNYEIFDYQYLLTDYTYLEDGKLGLPEYRAIVVEEAQLGYDAAVALQKLSDAGYPIIFVGDNAATTTGDLVSDDDLAAVVSAIKANKTTATVASDADLPDALSALGVEPRAALSNGTNTGYLWSSLEKDGDVTYLSLYNQSDELQANDTSYVCETFDDPAYDASATLSLEGLYTPYELNLWTGEVTAVENYTYENGRTVFEAEVPAETMVTYIFDSNVDASAIHSVKSTADSVYQDAEGLKVAAAASGTYQTTMSNGYVVNTKLEVPEIETSGTWNLSIEAWTEGEKKERSETVEAGALGNEEAYTTTEVYYETKKTLVLDKDYTDLKIWRDIDAEDYDFSEVALTPDAVAGVGFYETTVTLPEDWSAEDGLLLNLGQFDGYARVAVNQDVAKDSNVWKAGNFDYYTVNSQDPEVKIQSGLHAGENKIQVCVITTLSGLFLNGGYDINGTTESDGTTNRFQAEGCWWIMMFGGDFSKGNGVITRGLNGDYGLTDVSISAFTTKAIDDDVLTLDKLNEKLQKQEEELANLKKQAEENAARIAALEARVAKDEAQVKAMIKGIKAVISSIKASKSSFTIKIKKVSGADGYQIQYSTSKSMKNAKKVSTTGRTKTVKNLKKGKTYYVRVRAYKVVDGSKVYGNYSSKKKVTAK